jgi:hypothetical protein
MSPLEAACLPGPSLALGSTCSFPLSVCLPGPLLVLGSTCSFPYTTFRGIGELLVYSTHPCSSASFLYLPEDLSKLLSTIPPYCICSITTPLDPSVSLGT